MLFVKEKVKILFELKENDLKIILYCLNFGIQNSGELKNIQKQMIKTMENIQKQR